MLKEQLLEEAKKIDASVELDAIFESVDLSEDVKENFKTVFDASVKNHAIALAETHIAAIADKADALVESQVDEKVSAVETKLVENIDKFLNHLTEEWLAENKLAVENGIKADLFESMFAGIKELVIEHNVVLPEESVDAFAELESELQESNDEVKNLFDQLTESQKELKEVKREVALKEATDALTESQKEKVESLVEGLEFNDAFATKVGAIVEMVKSTKVQEEKPLTESTINTDDPAGLNFVVEAVEEKSVEKPQSNAMSAYIRSAKNLG